MGRGRFLGDLTAGSICRLACPSTSRKKSDCSNDSWLFRHKRPIHSRGFSNPFPHLHFLTLITIPRGSIVLLYSLHLHLHLHFHDHDPDDSSDSANFPSLAISPAFSPPQSATMSPSADTNVRPHDAAPSPSNCRVSNRGDYLQGTSTMPESTTPAPQEAERHSNPYQPVGDFLSNVSRFKIIESTLREGEQFANAFFDTGKSLFDRAIRVRGACD